MAIVAIVAWARAGRAEQRVTVAALERALLADGDVRGLRELVARPIGGQVAQPVGERAGMGAATDRFAVRVEQHDLDIGEPAPHHQLADAQAQPLDLVGGGELAHVAAAESE